MALLVAFAGLVLIAASFTQWRRPAVVIPPAPRAALAPPPAGLAPSRARGQAPEPVGIVIPSIGVSAPVVPLGLNADGTLQVPSQFGDAGWYMGSAVPGTPGAAVIVGHVDSRDGPAVFFRLRDVLPGSTIELRMRARATRRFVVTNVAEYPKSSFPTTAVYGPTATATLHLITCGGRFDFSTGHYLDNVVVFAHAAPVLDRARSSGPRL